MNYKISCTNCKHWVNQDNHNAYFNCEITPLHPMSNVIRECEHYKEKMNNYERIKQMSVKDMAEILRDFKCSYCILSEKECEKKHKDVNIPDCLNYIKQWLLAECKE